MKTRFDGCHLTDMERLQKIIAQAGISSRRGAEKLIKQGRIQVNGKVVTEMGFKVTPGSDSITFDGVRVDPEARIYILLNKPEGYVTTLSDPQGRPIVTDLLPDIQQRLFPVGRLDINTEGALLMTNDGGLSNYILHPRYKVYKTYEVIVRNRPETEQLKKLSKGIEIDGHQTLPARLRLLGTIKNGTRVEIIIHEGKKRQVRKMFEAIGHPVIKLKRTAYGNLKLNHLETGKYRFLTKNDLKRVFSGKIPFTIKNITD